MQISVETSAQDLADYYEAADGCTYTVSRTGWVCLTHNVNTCPNTRGGTLLER